MVLAIEHALSNVMNRTEMEYDLMICAVYINLTVLRATHILQSRLSPTKLLLHSLLLRARVRSAVVPRFDPMANQRSFYGRSEH